MPKFAICTRANSFFIYNLKYSVHWSEILRSGLNSEFHNCFSFGLISRATEVVGKHLQFFLSIHYSNF